MDTMDQPTNPTSYPINQPSHTYFSIPYTGAFTEVTSDECGQQSVGEHTPLVGKRNNNFT